MGIVFQNEGDFYRPYNLGNGLEVDHPLIYQSQARPALTAACLLVNKKKFVEVNGFDEVYEYGFEDVDLGLKLLQAGYSNYYCAESVLIHHEFGTQSKNRRAEVVGRRKRNLQHFRNKWFHYLKSAYWMEKVESQPSFYAEAPLDIVIVGSLERSSFSSEEIENLISDFKSFGWRVNNQTGISESDVRIDHHVDVILSLSLDFTYKKLDLDKTKKRRVKILCTKNREALNQVSLRKKMSVDHDVVFDVSDKNLVMNNPIIFSSHYLTRDCLKNDVPKSNVKGVSRLSLELRALLLKIGVKKSIAIKMPVRKWKDCHRWGDYYLAQHLRGALLNEEFSVLLQIVPEWGNARGMACDVVIVLRGLVAYEPSDYQINLMWNISHPKSIKRREYEQYDKIFVASEGYAKTLTQALCIPVEVMLQCTDPSQFYEPSPEIKTKYYHQLLFIGNSRRSFKRRLSLLEFISKRFFSWWTDPSTSKRRYNIISRKIIRDLLPTYYDLSIYGLRWDGHIAEQVIKGDYVSNSELYKYYGSAGILLNDHWKDMRKNGFISNRIFDGLACGAFILTDDIEGNSELKKYMTSYSSKRELQQHIDYYLNNPVKRIAKAQAGKKYVLENHTFTHRARQFATTILLLSKI